MSRTARLWLFAVAAGGLAALLAWAFAGLPSFGTYLGRYGRIVAHIAVPERTATNAVTVTAFDIRAVDTLVEEFIVFAAAIAAVALLRRQREGATRVEHADEELRSRTSPALRVVAAALAGPTFVLAVDLVAHGHLTPGGGFQGGIALAAVAVLLVVGGARLAIPVGRPPVLGQVLHGAGAAGFVAIGLGGLVFGVAFLDSTILGGGREGALLSGGTIPLLNVATGLEVGGALLVILSEFLQQDMLAGEDERG